MPQTNDRVLYLPPYGSGRQARFGCLQCTSGASALILFDDYAWPQWAPLGRLYRVTTGAEGWLEIELMPAVFP
ncbi:MAG: hypothetical protein E6Q97_14160 [Desulfurellales bacterium]|nr:MAG: hypothetical protein E6Q97_14160 [Desulfurellales bacterium]